MISGKVKYNIRPASEALQDSDWKELVPGNYVYHKAKDIPVRFESDTQGLYCLNSSDFNMKFFFRYKSYNWEPRGNLKVNKLMRVNADGYAVWSANMEGHEPIIWKFIHEIQNIYFMWTGEILNPLYV